MQLWLIGIVAYPALPEIKAGECWRYGWGLYGRTDYIMTRCKQL